MKEHARGALFLVGAALFWSFGGLLIKLVDANPLGVAGARSAIAALVIGLYMRRRIVWSWEMVLGALAYAGTVGFFVAATKLTTAANAILLQYTAPIYVALLSPVLLGERITRVDWFSILAVFGGMALFFMDELSAAGMLGNVFAVISGIFFALCVLALRKGRHGSSIDMVLLGNVITAVICFPFIIPGPAFGADDIAWLVLLGVVQLGLGYIFFVKGVRYVPAIEAALLPVIEPILNPIWVVLFQGERPGLLPAIGGVIVIASVTARGVYKARMQRRVVITTPHPN